MAERPGTTPASSLIEARRRRAVITTSESYIYDSKRVQALYEQLKPDPDLYGDDPVYAVFAYLHDSPYGADVFDAQGDWGQWIDADEEYDPDA